MMFKNFLQFPQEASSATRVALYMLIAYLFGMLVRFVLWYQVVPFEAFWLEGHPLPIYSPDAGLYGYYAKQLLLGVSYPFSAEYMPGRLIAFFVGTFGFDVDWVVFLLPAFLAPLVAIPTVLMAHALGSAKLGFYAALIATIGINFYSRSYLGYMDTDLLNLFFPYMAVASAMMALTRKSVLWVVLFVASLAGFYVWYHSALAIIAAIIAMVFVVAPLVYRQRIVAVVSAVLVIAALLFVDFEKVGKRASDYYNTQSSIDVTAKGQTYHFVNTLDSVSEAQDVNVLSAHPLYISMAPYTVLATLGFILLALMRPVLLMALPLIALGYAASVMGMRFTMFATSAYALGFMGLFMLAGSWLKWRYVSVIGVIAGVAIMVLNVMQLNPTCTPSFFKNDDVATLESFAHTSSEDDLLISWWDYGWPLWYYTGHRNTLVDNGRHGADTYLVANLLLSKSDAFVANAMHYFGAKQQDGQQILPHLAKEENLQARFDALRQGSINLPLERDIYIMLHRDMLLTFQTLEDFAHIDLSSGQMQREHAQIYISDLLRPYTKKVSIINGDTFDFDLRNGMIKGHDGATTQVHGVIIAENGNVVAAKPYNARSSMNLIIYNKTKAIYLDNNALNTFLVKALLLDRYDQNRFEKVAETEAFKILKLKH